MDPVINDVPDFDPIMGGPETSVTPAVKRGKGGAGYCETCRSFISNKYPHTPEKCAANIAARANRKASPRRRLRLRLTPKRISKLKEMARLAAFGSICVPKMNALSKYSGRKASSKTVAKCYKSVAKKASVSSSAVEKKAGQLLKRIGM